MRSLGKKALAEALMQSRKYTKSLLDDLSDAQWNVPRLPTINPPLWEIGHVGWFMERWCLRADGAPSLLPLADSWYDSSAIAHAERWSLPLPNRAATLTYLDDVLAKVLDGLARAGESEQELYFFRLALAHEDMHAESFAYTRQTLGYPAPRLARQTIDTGSGDVQLGGAEFELGAARGAMGFVFDNEKWSHPVRLGPFAIARRPVLQGEFIGFIGDDGYRRPELWSEAGREWLASSGATQPAYWRHEAGGWRQRVFDRWLPIDPAAPMMHVTAHEAEAYCRWARCRLPTEAEWEFAAMHDAIAWGGTVWEWTASPFGPYPGFEPDAYRDYSAPWFHTHRSVRGASFATPSHLKHPKFRNFYEPQRADIFVGFRTCRTLQ
jgi:gamma-glutamyl hercynylcysteine S-oxide synthase